MCQGPKSGARGFSYLEVVFAAGLLGMAGAIAIPALLGAIERNRVIAAADLVAAQIRAARLSAISRNATFQVRFDCPDAGAVRVLAVTGNAAIDNAQDRCSQTVPSDGPPVYVTPGVALGQVPTLIVSGRGLISADGAAMPLSISVSHGTHVRTLVVSAIGRVATPEEP
jgi:type II secretory pathway pseudopilin PulG